MCGILPLRVEMKSEMSHHLKRENVSFVTKSLYKMS